MTSRPLSLRRAAIAAVLAAVVPIAASRTGGWFTPDGAYYEHNLDRMRLLLPLLLAPLLYALPTVARRTTRTGWIVFAAWTAFLGFWLVALWPGIVMTDTHSIVVTVRSGIMQEWFSWLHALYVMAAMDIVPQVWFMALLQVLATAATMAYASQVLLDWRRSVPAVVAMNVLAALAVPIAVNAVLLSRDTSFALLHVVLALAVAQVVTRQRRATPVRIGWIAVATGVLSVLRGDGIVLLAVVPALLLALRPPRSAVLRTAAGFAAAAVVFHVALPAVFHIEDQGRAYAVSLRINPLGAVLNRDFYSPDRASDLEGLGHVIDVEAVRQMHDPSEIPAFWANKWNPSATPEQFAAFQGIANRLLVQNLGTTLGNRVETFMGATGLNRGQFTTPPLDRAQRWSFIGRPEGIVAEPPSAGLYDIVADFVGHTSGYTGAVSARAALWWDFLPLLAVLGGVLLAWRRLPFAAAAAAVLLCRVPLLFLVEPASQFKYYLSVQVGGIVVVGFLLAALHDRRRTAVIPSGSAPDPARHAPAVGA